jgi:hypothetical protein
MRAAMVRETRIIEAYLTPRRGRCATSAEPAC